MDDLSALSVPGDDDDLFRPAPSSPAPAVRPPSPGKENAALPREKPWLAAKRAHVSATRKQVAAAARDAFDDCLVLAPPGKRDRASSPPAAPAPRLSAAAVPEAPVASEPAARKGAALCFDISPVKAPPKSTKRKMPAIAARLAARAPPAAAQRASPPASPVAERIPEPLVQEALDARPAIASPPLPARKDKVDAVDPFELDVPLPPKRPPPSRLAARLRAGAARTAAAAPEQPPLVGPKDPEPPAPPARRSPPPAPAQPAVVRSPPACSAPAPPAPAMPAQSATAPWLDQALQAVARLKDEIAATPRHGHAARAALRDAEAFVVKPCPPTLGEEWCRAVAGVPQRAAELAQALAAARAAPAVSPDDAGAAADIVRPILALLRPRYAALALQPRGADLAAAEAAGDQAWGRCLQMLSDALPRGQRGALHAEVMRLLDAVEPANSAHAALGDGWYYWARRCRTAAGRYDGTLPPLFHGPPATVVAVRQRDRAAVVLRRFPTADDDELRRLAASLAVLPSLLRRESTAARGCFLGPTAGFLADGGAVVEWCLTDALRAAFPHRLDGGGADALASLATPRTAAAAAVVARRLAVIVRVLHGSGVGVGRALPASLLWLDPATPVCCIADVAAPARGPAVPAVDAADLGPSDGLDDTAEATAAHRLGLLLLAVGRTVGDPCHPVVAELGSIASGLQLPGQRSTLAAAVAAIDGLHSH